MGMFLALKARAGLRKGRFAVLGGGRLFFYYTWRGPVCKMKMLLGADVAYKAGGCGLVAKSVFSSQPMAALMRSAIL